MIEKDEPIITVVTVTYNAETVLEKTICSVINQTYSKVEYIIIDGGSTDTTLDIIKRYEGKISFWKSEPDNGIYDAMNKGIDIASGKWINFMNAGDEFFANDTIDTCFKRSDLEEYDIIYGNAQICKDSEILIYKPEKPEKFWKKLVIHQSIFSKTEISKRYKFDTSLKVSGDFDFIYKIFFFKHKTLHLDVVVVNFNIIGYSHFNRYIGFQEDRKIAMRYQGNLYLSITVYIHYIIVTVIGKLVDFCKKYMPNIYNKLKKLKDSKI